MSRDWNSGFKACLDLFREPCCLFRGGKVTLWFEGRKDKEASIPEPFLCVISTVDQLNDPEIHDPLLVKTQDEWEDAP